MSIKHESPAPITITLTEQQVFDELSGCNAEFSPQTMQLIGEFLTQLAAMPEHCLTRELTLPRALELLASIVSGLWETYLQDRESGSQAPAATDEHPKGPGHGKLKIVLEEMWREQAEAVREEQPVFSTYYLAAMSAICSSSHGLDAFRRYVRQRTQRQAAPARQAAAPNGSGESERPLSQGQQSVFDFCFRIGRLFYKGQSSLPNIKIPCFPLIVGPTGAGKTHVVRQLAEGLDCHYMRLDYGTWLPHGARESPNTMEAICEAALKYERVLVHLDELDKLQGGYDGGWERSVKTDIWRLLDRPIELCHIGAAQRFEEGEQAFAEMFAQRVWIVGSGTWQEVFDSPAKSIGFATGSEDSELQRKEMVERIHESRLIAPELTGRFNSKLQLIDYPKVEEVTQLLAVSGIELADAQIEQLRETMPRSGFRAVEDTVTDVALQRFEAMEREAERTRSAPELAPERERPTLNEATARAETKDEAYEDDFAENWDEDDTEDFEADCDPWGPVIEPGFYTVNFPFSERMRYVDVSYAWAGRLKLKWYRCVHGLQCSARDGFNTGLAVLSYEPVRFMELWPQFARKHGLSDYTEVDVWLFRSWNPQPCEKPPVADLHSEPRELYEFWRRQRRDHDAELEGLRENAVEMLAPIHPESDTTEELIRYYDLSEALLCSTARAKAPQAQPHSGPNLVELRAQYEKFVNEGLEWFRWHIGSRDIEPAIWSSGILQALVEWEHLLVQETAKDISRRSLVCETVNCPLKMQQTMDLFEPDLSWDKMSDAVRNRYLMLFHRYLTSEAAA